MKEIKLTHPTGEKESIDLDAYPAIKEMFTADNAGRAKPLKVNFQATSKKRTALIQVTEHRSSTTKWMHNNIVRIFVNKDWSYGYFVNEELVFSKFDEKQKTSYLKCKSDQEQFEIPIEDAQHLIDVGINPYGKQNLIEKCS